LPTGCGQDETEQRERQRLLSFAALIDKSQVFGARFWTAACARRCNWIIRMLIDGLEPIRIIIR
jgi:hypothetical protein